MTKQVLIVSHADADGHVIAEQVRRNLSAIPTFDISLVVDPVRTKDHTTWNRLDDIHEIDDAEIVFFVDLMFAPASFAHEADALVRFVNDRPDRTFFLIDHHPLPLRRLSRASNLRAMYRPDVFDCTLGPASGLMVIAALLEKQPTRTRSVRTPVHNVLATGVRRAAAYGGPLPGEKLLALLRFNRWDALAELGEEDSSMHRLPRGRRAKSGAPSAVLAKLNRIASRLLRSAPSSTTKRRPRNPMSYDIEAMATDSVARRPPIPVPDSKDLEAIVMLLELAAIQLTPDPEATFTKEELIEQARAIGGEEIDLDETDVKIVLGKTGFLKTAGRGRLRMK